MRLADVAIVSFGLYYGHTEVQSQVILQLTFFHTYVDLCTTYVIFILVIIYNESLLKLQERSGQIMADNILQWGPTATLI